MTIPSSFAKKIKIAGASGLALSLGFAAAPMPATAVNGGGVGDSCDSENTVVADMDATTGPDANRVAIQDLVDGGIELICLEGEFVLSAPVFQLRNSMHYVDFGDVHFYGLGSSSVTTEVGSFFYSESDYQATIENLAVHDIVGSTLDGTQVGAVVAAKVLAINSSFSNNSGDFGGAVTSADFEAVNSSFSSNSALLGGAVFVVGSAVITNSTFSNNQADEWGGGLLGYSVAVSGSTFLENSAKYGGAIWTGDLDVSNSTFLENEAVGEGAEGGAIFAEGSGSVVFSTFVNNVAPSPDPDVGEDIPGNSIYRTGDAIFEIGGNIFAGTDPNPQLGIGEAQKAPFIDLGGNVFSTTTEPDLIYYVEDDDDLPSHPHTFFGASLTNLFGSVSPSLDDHEPNTSGTQVIALADGSPAIDIVEDNLEFIGDLKNEDGALLDQRGATRTAPFDAGSVEFFVQLTPGPEDEDEDEDPAPTTTPPATTTASTTPPAVLAKTGTNLPLWLVGFSGALGLVGALALAARRKVLALNKYLS